MRAKFFFVLALLVAASGITAQGGFRFDRAINTAYPAHNGAAGGSLAVGDLDGNGLSDIVVSGLSGTTMSTLIYMQSADGVFSTARKSADHGLPPLDRGACVRLADMDGDGLLDVVMFGRTGVSADTALFRVYKNDTEKFTLMADLGKDLPPEDFADLPGAWGATSQGDNKTDAAVKGLYNGLGWSKGILELADLDGDGDPDIIFSGTKGMESGTDAAGQMIQRDWEMSGVFINGGAGKFEYLSKPAWPQAGMPANPETEPERSASGLPKLQRGASAAADFNGDGKTDVLMLGQANTGSKANPGIPESQRNGLPFAELCLGNGDGTFRPFANHGIKALIDCSLRVVDFNADGKPDVAVLGSTGQTKDPAGGRFVRIYLGKGDGSFVEDPRQAYDRVPNSADCMWPAFNGDLAFGDLDGDGDLDMLLAGNTNDKSLFAYQNNGGKFAIADLDKMKNGIGTNSIQGMAESDAVIDARLFIGDIDGDGDADVVLNGVGGSMQLLVFRNKLK